MMHKNPGRRSQMSKYHGGQDIPYFVHQNVTDIIHISTRHVSFSILIGRNSVAEGLTYGRQFYDLIWSLALVNASIEHGLKVAGSCPLAR
jgi:hypothetical protein